MGDWPILSYMKFATSTYDLVVNSPGSAKTKSTYSHIVASAPFDVGGVADPGAVHMKPLIKAGG